MARIVRLFLLVFLLAILASLVWLRATRDGREMAGELSHRWQQSRHGDEQRDAAEKLAAMGAHLGRLPPDQRLVSIDCKDKSLGDEGYRLVGKCFSLETASFVGCDLNDKRMQHLAGLVNLTSLVIANTPAVTDEGIKHIASLQQLVGLILNGSGIGDAVPQATWPASGTCQSRPFKYPGHRRRDAGVERSKKAPVAALGPHGGYGRRRGQSQRLGQLATNHVDGEQGDRQGQVAVEKHVPGAEDRLTRSFRRADSFRRVTSSPRTSRDARSPLQA